MKAKLIKKEDDFYSLRVDRIVMATSNGMLVDYKLSKQNCDEIFGVVDVDKLAYSMLSIRFNENAGYHKFVFVEAYKEGYNKAMELNKDKLFTTTNLRVGMINLLYLEKEKDELSDVFKERQFKFVDEYIQSLQQPTEIEVEIRCYIGNGDKESDSFKNPLVTNTGIPKLDENGCLILRKL